MRRRLQRVGKKVFVILCLLFVSTFVALLWPTAGYDPHKVDPHLRELLTPYQSVFTNFYADGGSLTILIVDQSGRQLELALPINANEGISYPRLYVGASHASFPDAVEVPFTKDTRRMLIAILEKYRTPSNHNDIGLTSLRGAPQDYAKAAVARFFPSSSLVKE